MAGAAQQAVLDFGQVVDAIMVGEAGRLSLHNISLVNAAPRHAPHTDTHARYRVAAFGPWPSLTVLPNATVRQRIWFPLHAFTLAARGTWCPLIIIWRRMVSCMPGSAVTTCLSGLIESCAAGNLG